MKLSTHEALPTTCLSLSHQILKKKTIDVEHPQIPDQLLLADLVDVD